VISLLAATASGVLHVYGVSSIILAGRCVGFALGGLIALLFYGHVASATFRTKWSPAFGAILVAASLLAAGSTLGLWTVPLQIAFSISFFGLVGFVVLRSGDRWLAFLRAPALIYVGTISYGLYLYHIPVDRGIEAGLRKIGIHHRLDVGYPLWRTIGELSAVFLVAVLSWHLIEKPLLKLKSRFDYRSRDRMTGQ
jgi:peptidoglycan/LPS O-acetylase OafA/YrhL